MRSVEIADGIGSEHDAVYLLKRGHVVEGTLFFDDYQQEWKMRTNEGIYAIELVLGKEGLVYLNRSKATEMSELFPYEE